MRKTRNSVAITLATTLALCAVAQSAISYDTIALTGTDGVRGPGLGDGITFSSFSGGEVFINNSGRAFFEANVRQDGPVTDVNNNGVWLHSPASGNALYMRENAPVGNGAGATSFDFPTFSNYGRPAFQVKPGQLTQRSIYAGSLAQKIVEFGDLVPGTNGATFHDIGQPRLNASGTIAFLSRMTGGDYPQGANGILTATSGSVPILRLKPYDVAPGVPNNAQFAGFTPPSFNDAGQIAFTGYLASYLHPEINSINYKGIWAGTPNSLTLVARGQSSAPGANGAHFFIEDDTHIALNNNGDVAFFAKLGGAGTTEGGNDRGLWAGPRNGVQLIARSQSTSAHPTNPAVKFTGFSQIALSAQGSVLFHASMAGGGVTPWHGGEGVFFAKPGSGNSLRAIVRSGDSVAGEAPGVTVQSVSVYGFNANEIALLVGDVQGTGITEANDLRLWFATTTGDLLEIARQGGTFDVNPHPLITDLRTINGIGVPVAYGNEEGRGFALNDNETAVFTLSFTDGSSGVFTADFAQMVPEPGVAAAFSAMLAIRCRRSKASPPASQRIRPSRRRTCQAPG